MMDSILETLRETISLLKQDYVRISLAFNTFLRGSLGGGLGALKIWGY